MSNTIPKDIGTEIDRRRLVALANKLGMALTAARGHAKNLQDELGRIADAVAALEAENIPTIRDSVRSNHRPSALRDAMAAVFAALDRLATLRQDALSAHCADQRPAGWVGARPNFH